MMINLIDGKKVIDVEVLVRMCDASRNDIKEDLEFIMSEDELKNFNTNDDCEDKFYIYYEQAIFIAKLYEGNTDLINELFGVIPVLANPMKKVEHMLNRYSILLNMKKDYTEEETSVLIDYFFEMIDKIYYDYRLLKYNKNDDTDEVFDYISIVIYKIHRMIKNKESIVLSNVLSKMYDNMVYELI